MSIRLDEQHGSVLLHIKVVPGASRTRVMGALGEALKIAVAKPPSAGEANQAVVGVIAELFAIAARDVKIISGQTNPRKIVQISGISAAQARDVLAQAGIKG